jgi:hypothetical protein
MIVPGARVLQDVNHCSILLYSLESKQTGKACRAMYYVLSEITASSSMLRDTGTPQFMLMRHDR